jgi:tRNA pseudouridine55 synthase
VVDKPAGMTSHDVVGLLRRRLGERRIGHSGTLDPDATGVLLCGVGNLTRFLRYLTDLPKTYTAEVVFGSTTSSLDDSGEVTATFDMGTISLVEARRLVAEHLTGPILQVPPMVSAIRVDGRRLHELAREGIEVDREARPVTIHRYDIDATDDPNVFAIEVQCSSGTYIRSLGADLGALLGGGAHVRAIRRTAIGGFSLDDAASPELAPLYSMAEALRRDYTSVAVDEEAVRLIRHGRSLPLFDGTGPWSVSGPDGELLAMYEARDGVARPTVVVPESLN